MMESSSITPSPWRYLKRPKKHIIYHQGRHSAAPKLAHPYRSWEKKAKWNSYLSLKNNGSKKNNTVGQKHQMVQICFLPTSNLSKDTIQELSMHMICARYTWTPTRRGRSNRVFDIRSRGLMKVSVSFTNRWQSRFTSILAIQCLFRWMHGKILTSCLDAI